MRDLLDMHLDIGHAFPRMARAEKALTTPRKRYSFLRCMPRNTWTLARLAMDFAAKEYKSRDKILMAKPGPGNTPDQAAREILSCLPAARIPPAGDR